MMVVVNQVVRNDELKFTYGDLEIKLQRQERIQNNNRVLIKVYPDCQVVAFASREVSDKDVLTAARKRARWIYKHIKSFQNQIEHIIPRNYISGESHYYLGKQYVLKVLNDISEPQAVKFFRGSLLVNVHQKTSESVYLQLQNWYRKRAKYVFSKRLENLSEKTLWVCEVPKIRLLSMRTQWGSCSPKGHIVLNPNLIKAPTECIDYVILHELCHLAEHNHSERFYQLMNQVMPNWPDIKTRLDALASKYLNF